MDEIKEINSELYQELRGKKTANKK
ncbi:MAG: hypothetical protein C5S41_01560 [Candidatus Methanomarinus sp.]|nr:MAG: hypothetical protein C5S41_01560 [ANME-2 cluster archaeon]